MDFCRFASGNENYYRIRERAFASDIWQTKCFHKSKQPTSDELRDLCIQLGVSNTTKISFNALNDTSKRPDIIAAYGNAGIKVEPFKLTSTLSVNDNFKVQSFRPSRIASTVMVPWTEKDHTKCYQMEINCHTWMCVIRFIHITNISLIRRHLSMFYVLCFAIPLKISFRL